MTTTMRNSWSTELTFLAMVFCLACGSSAGTNDGRRTDDNHGRKKDAGAGDARAPVRDAAPADASSPDAAMTTPPPDKSAPDSGASVDAGIEGCGNFTAIGTAHRAVSGGFSGTEEAYFSLYDVECAEADDCSAECQTAGGSGEMCAESSCLAQSGDAKACLPPTVWRSLENIEFEGVSPLDGVEITVVASDYNDLLFVDDFRLEVPEDAEIQGVTLEVRRAGSNRVADEAVHLHLGQQLGEKNRSLGPVWTDELRWIEYGGSEDLWGLELTAADVANEEFGAAVSVRYTGAAGNTRAYVDQVRMTVHYHIPCE